MGEQNDPRILKASALITALLHDDIEGRQAALAEFESPSEALAMVLKVTVGIIKIMASKTDPPQTPEEVWSIMAQAIAYGDDS